MNFDLTKIMNLPTTPDAGHLILLSTTVILLITTMLRKTVQVDKIIEKTIPVEIEKIVEVVKEVEVEKIVEIEKIVEVPTAVQEADPTSAYQLLSLLQNEARFIDFIQEDLINASDEQVGAAARIIHSGSQKVVNEYFQLSAIRREEEESQITIAEGFNPAEIKLVGNVLGKAPYRGILTHQGWKITASNLPKLAKEHNTSIIAAAEVEL